MNVSLYQAAAGLNANARWQELIAENLTSSLTPGYKKQDVAFSAIQGGLLPAPTSGVQNFTVPRATAMTNFTQGEFTPTRVNTDFALSGSGFFTVQLPNGDTAYTRNGEFHVDATGQLVTKQGYLVLSDSGPIQTDPSNHAEISVSVDGEVSHGTDTKGRLQITSFNDPSLLTSISSGYYIARRAGLQPAEATDTTVAQGFLESSNTSGPAEMAKMIIAMRMYEANQKVIQSQDDRMGKVISELGRPN
jgi:flagellar basal-body rod protein FlgF